MAHAHAIPLSQPLDAKRIVATAGVIALHVGVLMMLMMPARVAQTVEMVPPWTPPDIQKVEIPLTPPPPKPDTRTTVEQPTPVSTPRPDVVDDPPPIVFTDEASAVDLPPIVTPPPEVIGDGGGSASPFVQLEVVRAPPPKYPSRAITQQWTGVVKLRIHVDATGKPMEVTVEESSGHAILDQAAVQVVKSRWLFVPATRDGAPIDAWALVPIEFVLN